jgi:hypothetical protein
MADAVLTLEELKALDLACMNLMETVRLGRKKQVEYIKEGDPEGAKSLASGIAKADGARVTLRNLISRSVIDKAEGRTA